MLGDGSLVATLRPRCHPRVRDTEGAELGQVPGLKALAGEGCDQAPTFGLADVT